MSAESSLYPSIYWNTFLFSVFCYYNLLIRLAFGMLFFAAEALELVLGSDFLCRSIFLNVELSSAIFAYSYSLIS